MKNKKQIETSARQAAKRVDLIAKKSRRAISCDNLGGFMLVDAAHNYVVCGERFELTANEVIVYCAK